MGDGTGAIQRKESPKWTMVGGGDQIGACMRENRHIGEMSMKSYEDMGKTCRKMVE